MDPDICNVGSAGVRPFAGPEEHGVKTATSHGPGIGQRTRREGGLEPFGGEAPVGA
jgi:hypothetical protein